MSVTVNLSPEAREMLEQMPQRGDAALQAMARELDHQNELTIGYAQRNKLSGPRPGVLGVVTNRLRSSLRRTTAKATGNQVIGGIGSNVVYAAVHEYGFDGDVEVSAFVRGVRSRDVRVKKKIAAAGIGYVKAFTRHMRMPARSFIRSSITERLPEIEQGLSQAVVNALGGAA